MRVAIIVPHWFERGIAWIAWQAREALIDAGHEVLVLSRPSGRKPKGLEFDIEGVTRSGLAFANPGAWLKDKRVDTVLAVGCSPMALPCPAALFQMWEMLDPALTRDINAYYDVVIAPTACIGMEFERRGLKRVEWVPWGAELDVFQPGQFKQGPMVFFQPVNFGGQFGRKGLSQTLRAFREADSGDAALIVHHQRGSGVETDGRVVTYRGTLQRWEMAELYRGADVALLPSAWEGLGLCFLEALASGLAIVTLDAPPMCEYVERGVNGILLDAELKSSPGIIHAPQAVFSLDSYREAIEWMASDPIRAREMGRASREIAEEQYDWSKNGKKLVEVMEAL